MPESFDAINRDVNYVPHTGSLPESFTTLTRYVNYVKTGAVDVNGTAHVSGTAKLVVTGVLLQEVKHLSENLDEKSL